MGFYLELGTYYWEGDPKPQAKSAIEVPKRPSPQHVWDGEKWQNNTDGRWVYDKPSMRFVLRPPEEIAAIEAEIVKRQILEENMVLAKFARIMLLELNAIRAKEPRPQEVTDFIDKVKEYLV